MKERKCKMAASLSIPRVKIEDLCRTCLSRDTELHSLFSIKCGSTTLDLVIASITGIKVHPNDGLPTSVCKECKEQATNAFEFKRKSQESDATLQKLIKTENPSFDTGETKNLECQTFEVKVEQGFNDNTYYDMEIDYTALSTMDDDYDAEPVKEENNKDAKLQCEFCSTILESEEQLKNHSNNCCLKEFTGDTGSYCPLCGVCYENCKNLTKHMWASHADLMGPKKRGRPKSLETNSILNKLSENGFRIKTVHFKKFNCTICRKLFKNKEELVKHLADHKDTKLFSCLLCKKIFLKETKFNDHACTNLKNDKNEPAEISQTGDILDEITLQSILGRLEHPENAVLPQVCSRCSQVFVSTAELRCHIDDDHPEQSLRCNNCFKVFASIKGAVRHRKVCKQVEKTHQCTTCGVKFAYEITLNKHILRFHEGESVSVNFIDPAKKLLDKKYQCDTCKKAFCRKDLLEKHFRVHMEKTIECDICHKLFHRKDNMKTHRKTHEPRTEVKLNTSLCLYCGRSFNNSSNLIVHMRRHTGEKPYKCDFCGKGFPRSSDLQCHRRSHTGERPCVCKICGKAFSRTNKLTRHMRVHTGVKPYKCTYCEKAFSQSNDLTLHVRRHTGDKPYICEVCGDRFIQGTALQNHRRAHGHFPTTSSEPTATSLSLLHSKTATSLVTKLSNDNSGIIK